MLVPMKAMVFAAGIGSRLKELTRNSPKCLMKAGGKTLLEHVLLKLKAVDVDEVTINVHHMPEMITSFLTANNNFGLRINISHETSLLDTGGGLCKVRASFEQEDAFIVHNSDIYSSTDLRSLVSEHRSKSAIATLAVMRRESKRGLFFDSQMRLVGWTEDKRPPPDQSQLFAFSGISVCSGAIFRYTDSREAFSIIETFLTAARGSQKVYGLSINPEQWTDIGTPESLKNLQEMLGE
jgi:MurNAc alpha-1-phosphate uridylyltransferase